MKVPNGLRKLLESLVLTLVIFAVNLFFRDNPGFLSWFGLPYVLCMVAITALYGLGWGLLQIVLSSLSGFLLIPLIFGSLTGTYWNQLADSLRFSLPLAVLASLGIGFVRNQQRQFRSALLSRLRRSVHQISAIKRKSSSLERVNRILENRVINQKDSITLLRSQVHKLASLNLEQALATLLETINLFTDIKSASIWSIANGNLATVATFGWQDAQPRPRQTGLEDSIEGYVYRNNKAFSVRMAMGTQEFARLDYQFNILTLPIRVRGRVWGVLNIEDLPFERYSLYTESVLEILLSLIEPYLADILDHEALYSQQEIDEDTGLPQATQLYRTLERDLEQRGNSGAELSLIVLEISNFSALLERYPRRELKRLFSRIKEEFDAAHNMKSRAFHFKNDSQLAIVLNGLGQDGTSFICLDLLSTIPGMGLAIGDQSIPLEIIVGFSTSHDTPTGGAMINVAENLLEMQRL